MDLYGTNRDPRRWREPERFDPERFDRGGIEARDLVSHGSGPRADGHRCPGEAVTQILLETLAAELAALDYAVPPQDLSVDLAHIPARPASGFVIANVRAA